jgi:hypothetical protein
MNEIFLSLVLVLTAGEYFDSKLLTDAIRIEQHTVGALSHSRTNRFSIGQNNSQLGLIGFP